MRTIFKLFLLVIVLNLIRYLVGGPIEAITIMEPMHAVMPKYPEVFNTNFGAVDFMVSLFYNFMLWFAAACLFHLAHPALKGTMMLKSLKIYGLLCLFFISLAAIYMNHYTEPIRPFYLYSMIDAVIVFAVVGLANGLLYPYFFKHDEARVR